MDGTRTDSRVHPEARVINPGEALASWGRGGPVRRSPDDGLINRTYVVGEPPRAVLP